MLPIAHPDPSCPVLSLSALEQAARIRDGSLSSVELVETYLSRIERLDGTVGAFVALRADAARREAARLDLMRDQGRLKGPFHGVPTAVKDLHLLRGSRVRFGSRAFRYLWSPVDDSLVRRLRAAGFVMLGKTSTSELALLPIVETDIHPPTRNPWDPSRTAGGSSGGAGAAVAAGMVPVAPGSDGAGSIRIPSSINGLIGLKPSRGRVPDDTARIDPRGMTTLGPMGRCVDDVAALLDVMASTPESLLARSLRPVPRLRIGLLLEPPYGRTDPRVAACVRQLADRLRGLGHHVEERAPVTGELGAFLPIYQEIFARIPVFRPGLLQAVTRWFRDEGRRLAPGKAAACFADVGRRGLEAMDGIDVLLTPTVPVVPPEVGAFGDLPPQALFEAASVLGVFTAVCNVTGRPALTLPAGTVDGLPVGAQLIGPAQGDGLLLALARSLEEQGQSADP